LGVLLAPAFAPSDWHDLSLVLGVITGATSLQRHFYRDVWQVSRALQPHIDTLIKSCSPDEFKALRRQLQVEFYSQEQFAIRQWESEINARLYGPKK
jgi:hypothetical protein